MLRRLLSNSFIYFALSMASSGVSFLILPIYTRLLSPEDFGYLGLIYAASGILSTTVGLSPQLFFNVEFKRTSSKGLQEATAAALLVPLTLAPMAFVLLKLLQDPLGMDRIPNWTFAVMVVLPVLGNARSVLITANRMRERPAAVAWIRLGTVGIEHSSALLLLILIAPAWPERIAGTFLAVILLGTVSVAALRREGLFAFRLSAASLRRYLKFLLPLVPHALGYWAINSQDRFFIGEMCGLEAVGHYSVAYQLCAVFPLVSGAVLSAFAPYIYKKSFSEQDKLQIVQFSYLYLMAVGVMFLVFVFLAVPLAPWFFGKRFVGSVSFLPWLAGAYAIGAIRDLSVAYLYRTSRNRLIGAITAIGAVLNAVLNWILIKAMGPLGAAVATTATFGAIAVITMYFGVRSMPMPWLSPLKEPK